MEYSIVKNWIDFCKTIMHRPDVLLIFLPITCFVVTVIALILLKKKLRLHLDEFDSYSPGKEMNPEVLQKFRYGSVHEYKD